MAGINTNPDLPLSWRRPGTYVAINLNNPGGAPGKRLLLLGEKTSSGLKAGNSLYRANSEQDVVDNSGATSVLRLLYNDAIAQTGPGVYDVWVGHVDEAGGGTAAVYEHLVSFDNGSNPAGSGQLDWWFLGRKASVGFVTSDTATTIADALAAEATRAFSGLPVTSVVASSGKITMTVKTKAAWGEDLPSQWYVTPGKNVRVGPGTYVYAVNAAGGGSATMVCGRKSYSFTITDPGGGLPPADVVTGMAAAITGDGPLTAVADTTNLKVYYQNDYPVRHVVAKIVTSTGTTINVNGRGAVAAGTDSPNGVVGLGAPTLTTLLTTIDAQSASYGGWAFPWSDTTTVGAIDAVVEDEGGGLKCKGQKITVGSLAALATAGAIPTGTSPALTASVRAAVVWPAFEAANAPFEYAVRVAAAQVSNDRPAKNFNGLKLKSTGNCPLLAPPPAARSSSADINSAINSYYMAPVVYDDAAGMLKIEHARTTSNSADRALHKWSLIAQLDAQRDLMRMRIGQKFTTQDGTGVSLMASGVPFSEGIVTIEDFEDAIYQALLEAEKLGYYDGADALKDGIHAQRSQGDPNRIDCVYTASALTDVDVVSMVGNRTSF